MTSAGDDDAGLTQRQHEVLEWIVDYIGTQRMSPTMAEISDAMGTSSRTSSWFMINRLIDRGLLYRVGEGAARNLRVTPEGLQAVSAHDVDHDLLGLVRAAVASRCAPDDLHTLAAALRSRGYNGEEGEA